MSRRRGERSRPCERVGAPLRGAGASWRRLLGFLGGVLALSGVPAGAAAGEPGEESKEKAPEAGGPPVGLEPSPMDILFPAHRARRLSLAIDVQRIAPRQEAITTVYPDDTWRLGLGLGGYLRHRIHPTLTGGVMRFEGNGIGQFSGTTSAETSTLWVFPAQLSVEYLFDYSWDQILIPYVGGGVDGWIWKESSPDAATSGVKWGLHGTAGVMLRLNFMETTTRWAQGSASHASDAGVTAGLTYAWVDSFGHGGLDFSGLSFGVGGVVAF